MWLLLRGCYLPFYIRRIPGWNFRIKIKMLRPAMRLMVKNLFMHHIADFLCLYGIVITCIGYTFGVKGFLFLVCGEGG